MGICLKYLFLNNESYNVCLPPYLWISKTQFGKEQIPDFDITRQQ